MSGQSRMSQKNTQGRVCETGFNMKDALEVIFYESAAAAGKSI